MKRRPKSSAPRPDRLFTEPEGSPRAHIAEIDGASRNNPGPASYGLVVKSPGGETLAEISKYLGIKTNNEAEYFSLIAALDYAEHHGIRALRVRSDSELVVQQMNGRYKVKSPALRPLHEQAKKMARRLEHFSIEYLPREKNREADRLANDALDQAGVPRDPWSGSRAAEARDSKLGTRSGGKRIRAVCRDGALHPAEPLGLAEGEMVEITIQRKDKASN